MHIQIGHQRAQIQLSFLIDNKGRGKKIGYIAHNLANTFSNCFLKFCFHIFTAAFPFPLFGALFLQKKSQLLLKITKQSSIIDITYIIHHLNRFDNPLF